MSAGSCLSCWKLQSLISLHPPSLVRPLILMIPQKIPAPILLPPLGFYGETSHPQRKHCIRLTRVLHLISVITKRFHTPSLCPPSGVDSLLSNSSLLTLCQSPELGLLPCSFMKYQDQEKQSYIKVFISLTKIKKEILHLMNVSCTLTWEHSHVIELNY